MSVECFGSYNGLPVYIDPHMDKDRILTLNNTDAKPKRETRVKEPRTKGLDHGRVTAFIMHPDTASKLKEGITNGII